MFRFSENPESAVWNLRSPSLLARVSFSSSVLLLLLLLILTPDIFDVEILFFNVLQRKNFQILTEFCQNLLEIWWKSWGNSEISRKLGWFGRAIHGWIWDFCLTGTGWSLGGFCGSILVYSLCYSERHRRDGGPFWRAAFGVFAIFRRFFWLCL